MNLPGLAGIRRAAAALREKLAPKALILMYHRVAEVESDPYWLAVTPRHFAEHMEVLRKQFRPVPLRRLADPGYRPGIGQRAVAITFDDGYVDNLSNAKPVLEHWDVPGTVYVTTGYVGQRREFWWDELEKLLLRPGTLPETLTLRINGATRDWQPGDAARYSEEDHQVHRSWNCEQPAPPRQSFLLDVLVWLRPLPASKQRQVLNQLAALAGNPPPRPSHFPLTPDEVIRLAEGDLVEIGAHTMTHPSLGAHPAAVQREEIVQSKAGLEELLGWPVVSFAYPFGTPADYTAETIDILRQAGFTSSVTTTMELVSRDSDRYQLPRFVVRDWDGDTFARKLGEYCHG